MKKLLIAFIGILLCGCNPAYYLDACCLDLEHEEIPIYFLPSKDKKSDILEDKFTMTETEFGIYLTEQMKNGVDIKKLLLDNGAYCVSDSECYFYFYPIYHFDTVEKYMFPVYNLEFKQILIDNKIIKSKFVSSYQVKEKNDPSLYIDRKNFPEIKFLQYKTTVIGDEIGQLERDKHFGNLIKFLKENGYAD